MSKSKAFKIVSHLSQALTLEEEVFEEQDLQFMNDFMNDFQEEQSFLREMKMIKTDPEPLAQKIFQSSLDRSILKKLHRKLAIKTHPDASGGDDSDFKKIQEAYEKEDAATLMVEALHYNIDVEVEREDLEKMMKDIHSRRDHLEKRKNTLRWVWGESQKDDHARKMIRAAMQIEETVFEEWMGKSKS